MKVTAVAGSGPATVTVPLLAAPGLTDTLDNTFPRPDPLPLVTVIHGALLVAVHAQPGSAWTSKEAPVCPVPGTSSLGGFTLYAHGAATCSTVNV